MRIFVDRTRRLDDGGDVEPAEVPALEARQEILQLARPVPVLARQHRLVAQMQVADPVYQRLAVFAVAAADRVADEFLVLVAGLHHGGAVEERLGDGDAAPHHHALPLGRAFIRIEVSAYRRMDAVGADQDIGSDLVDFELRCDRRSGW